MKTHSHSQKESTDSAFIPQVQAQLQSRPWAEPTEAINPDLESPEVQMEPETREGLGHNLANISIFAPTPPPESPELPPLQMKGLTIGKPGDKYEQEAVTIQTKPESVAPTSDVGMPTIQMDYKADKATVKKLFADTEWTKHDKTKKGKEYEKRDKFEYGFLTDEEVGAIERLGETDKGRKYLSSLKSSSTFLTSREEFQHGLKDAKGENTANYYKSLARLLDRNNNSQLTGRWLATGSHVSSLEFWSKRDLTGMERLLIATYQAKLGQKNEEYRKTPGYLRYEAQQAKQGSDEHKKAIYKKDTEAWEKLLSITEENKEDFKQKLIAKGIDRDQAEEYAQTSIGIANIMRRVFTVLQYNLKYSEQGEDSAMDKRTWKEWNTQVAVALSHGGRVNIRLPKLGDKYSEKSKNNAYYQERDRLINWMFGVSAGHKANERKSNELSGTDYQKGGVGTRSVSTHDVEIGQDSFKELKVSGYKETFGHWSINSSDVHYGINPALGGLGETDLAGNVILPDGSHGHIYIFYKPPTPDKQGAILIGGETSEMGKRDVFGKLHNASGTSAEFSPTGTGKAARIGSEIGGMRVDLSEFKNQEEIVTMFEAAMEQGVTPEELVGAPQLFGKSRSNAIDEGKVR